MACFVVFGQDWLQRPGKVVMSGGGIMRMAFHFGRSTPGAKTKLGWRGNPMVLVFAIAVIIYFANLLISIGKLTRDNYVPYEGEVLEVTTSWTDWLAFPSYNYEHLVIKTLEGNTADRFILAEVRATQNIAAGDYVVKEQGFGKWVRPRDKKTAQEMLDWAEEQLRNSR